MQSNDYLSYYQNKKGIKACENMGRLSDNLFYAQEKSHKHWLLSLDNLGLRTARRGRIHNLGFRTARRGRIQKKRPRVSSPCVLKTWGQTQKDRPRVSCSCLSAFYHAKIFSIFTKKVKGVQKCSWWTLFLQMK